VGFGGSADADEDMGCSNQKTVKIPEIQPSRNNRKKVDRGNWPQ